MGSLVDGGLKNIGTGLVTCVELLRPNPRPQKKYFSRQQSEAHSQLASAIASWGLAHNRDWNPAELNAATEAVEKFPRNWEM